MLNQGSFVDIVSGEPFTGEIPDPLEVVVSGEPMGGRFVTRPIVASPGDPEYDDVLTAWMLEEGFTLPEKE